jgi:hypothetical protein
MFRRGYNDRFKSRRTNRTLYYRAHGAIEEFQAFKLFRSAPIEDVGPNVKAEKWIDTEEVWMSCFSEMIMSDPDVIGYTKVQPFCRQENKPKGVTKMKRTSESISKGLYKALNQEATELLEAGKVKEFGDLRRTFFSKGKDLKRSVTFADQVEKAGGRCVKVPKGGSYPSVADWHEQDPT